MQLTHAAGSTVELGVMTRARGYTPFADAPPFDEEDTPLPIAIPAEELQHLTQHTDLEGRQADAAPSTFNSVLRFVWQGGSPGDAWLHMTAAQVI